MSFVGPNNSRLSPSSDGRTTHTSRVSSTRDVVGISAPDASNCWIVAVSQAAIAAFIASSPAAKRGGRGAGATVVGVARGPVAAVVDVDDGGVTPSGGSSASTVRKRNSPVRPTMRAASWRFLTPGRSTVIVRSWRLISGSATPRLLTRSSMMSRATSSAPGFTFPTASYVIEMPPWRSSPRTG